MSYWNEKRRLVFALVVTMLFIGTTFSSFTKGSVKISSDTNSRNNQQMTTDANGRDNQSKTGVTSGASGTNVTDWPGTTPYPGDGDWNYWSYPPNVFLIPQGNVGIGTKQPRYQLEIRNWNAPSTLALSNQLGQPVVLSYDLNNLFTIQSGGQPRLTLLPNGMVGLGTTSPLALFHIMNGAVLFSGTTGGTPVSGAGTRLMWIPSKAAFRAGNVDGNQWDDSNIGSYSFATGSITKANGTYSTAMGLGTIASRDGSTAMGVWTQASGFISTAMGVGTTASGSYSTAMGGDNTASGNYATAMGHRTLASGSNSTAMGYNTIASGNYTTAMGRSTIASGVHSTAMGYNTEANNDTSTAMGYSTIASGDTSTAMGWGTTASGYISTAMGRNTKASGAYGSAMGFGTIAFDRFSTAMGRYTNASGPVSTAMGNYATASGDTSTAMGESTTASGYCSTAMGRSTIASETGSTAMGAGTTASGDYSTAMGEGTTASGRGSIAMGGSTTASGFDSTAMGAGTVASGIDSTAMGGGTRADGDYSTAMGESITVNGGFSLGIGLAHHYPNWVVDANNVMSIMGGNVGINTISPVAKLQVANGAVLFNGTTGGTPVSGGGTRFMWIPGKQAFRAGYASGNEWDDVNIGLRSVATGSATKASGPYSTAMGASTTASLDYATAMGAGTTASGGASTAMGYGTTAGGWGSTAMGDSTTASGDYSTAMGRTITVQGTNSLGIGLAYHSPNWIVNSNNVMSIMGGNVGIGTTAPTTALDVVGDVKTTGDYKYNTAKTYYLNIPAAAFTGEYEHLYNYINNGSAIRLCMSSADFNCPVSLPQGATVTEFLTLYLDEQDSANLHMDSILKVRPMMSTHSNTMATLSFNSGGADPGVQSHSTSSITYPTIDNANNQYFIYLVFSVGDFTYDYLRFYGCRIAYTMDTIAP